jgi:hypothetical protein
MGNESLDRWTLTAALRRTRSVPGLDDMEFDQLARRITASAAKRRTRRTRARDIVEELARWTPWVFRAAVAAGIVGAVLLTRPEVVGTLDDSSADSTATKAFLDAVTGSGARDQVVAAVVWPLDGSWALAEESSP